MCGRYVSIATPEQLAEHFAVDDVRTDPLEPRYNVAPTLDVYAVIQKDDSRRLGSLRWGFLPHWADDLKSRPQPINARIEDLADSRVFERAFQKRRCLVPADGFYEWQERPDTRRKQPYYITDPDGDPLAFAGIWTVWRAEPDDDPVFSCAIVTTAARGRMEELHDRMPLMLPARLWDTWLTAPPEDAPHLQETVAALGPPRLEARRIGDRVNNVRNEGPELIEPGSVD